MTGSPDYPVTFGQEQLLDLERMCGPGTLVRPMDFPLDKGVSVPHVSAALRRVVQAHDALRMGVPALDGQGRQRAAGSRSVRLIPHDADPRAYGVLETWSSSDPAPLFFSVDPGDRHAMLTIYLHHAFIDGWSTVLIMRDFYRCYGPLLRGERPPALADTASFGRYATRQRDEMTGAKLERHNSFWATELRDAEPVILPNATGTWRPGLRAGHFPELMFEVKGPTAHAVQRIAARHGASRNVAMLAALAVAMARSTGQRDLLINTVLADRGTARTRSIVGCLVNKVTLRVRLPEDLEDVGAILLAVRGAWLRAARHQTGPFQQAGRHTEAGRVLNLNPRVTVVFNQDLIPAYEPITVVEAPEQPGLRHTAACAVWNSSFDSTDDLFLHVSPRRPEMQGHDMPLRYGLTYHPDLFTADGVVDLGTSIACWIRTLA